MNWILFVWLITYDGSPAFVPGTVTTAPFANETSCQEALKTLKQKAIRLNGVCIQNNKHK